MHFQNLIEFRQDLYLKLEFFVREEILITVSQRAPDKEAWPTPYHFGFNALPKI